MTYNRIPPHMQAQQPQKPSRWPTAGFIAGCVLVTLGIIAALGWGTPVITGNWNFTILGVGAVVAGIGVWGAVYTSGATPVKLRRVAVIAVIAIVSIYSTGLLTQVVIAGKPFAATSREAKAYRLTQDLYDDLHAMAEYDLLLDLPTPDARARYNQYEPAIQHMDELVAYWSNYDLGSLPDPDFIDVITDLKVAGTFGANALELRFGLLSQADVRSEQSMSENRAAYIQAVLQAGQVLHTLANRYDVQVVSVDVGE